MVFGLLKSPSPEKAMLTRLQMSARPEDREGEACVRCGAAIPSLRGPRPAACLTQDWIRVGKDLFRRGGGLCGLCASGPRRILYQLGGHREVVLGLLEDAGHAFLAPLLPPAGAAAVEVALHRDGLEARVGDGTELQREQVEEFVPEPEDPMVSLLHGVPTTGVLRRGGGAGDA